MTRNNKRVLYVSRGKTPPLSFFSLLFTLCLVESRRLGRLSTFLGLFGWECSCSERPMVGGNAARCNKGKEARERGAGFGCILQLLFSGLGVRWKSWTKVKLHGGSHVQRRITGIGDNDGSIDGFHDGRTASASCGRCRAKAILPTTRARRASSVG